MSVFFNALSAVSVLIMLMAVGYFMGYKGWMGQREKKFLGDFLINFAIPATCIVGLTGNLQLSQMKEYSIIVLAGAICVTATMVISVMASRILPMADNRRGVFAVMGGISNAIFIGLPVVMQIFGEVAMPYLMMYYLSNTIMLQTIGMMLIRKSGTGEQGGVGVVATVIDLLKKPPVVGIIISVIIIGFDIQIPTPIWSFLDYIGGTVSPLALIFCGFILYDLGLSRLRPMSWHWLMLALRLVIAPAITWCIVTAMGITGLARGVFTLVGGLPVVSQAPVFASTFGADEEYAAVGACLSTLLCCISVPILMVITGGV